MGFYRLLLSVFALSVLLPLVVRGDRAALAARLGRARPGRQAPHLWLHGASNGELASARPVVEALLDRHPDLHILITANTITGVELAQSWSQPRISARLAPLDLARATRRLRRAWQVSAHVTLESELWPNRLIQSAASGQPTLVLGARLTEGTARFWRRLGGAAQRALASVDWLSPQDTATGERLLALGLPPERLGPVVNLKALYRPDPARQPGPALRAAYPRTHTWLAASTHAPEEEIVLLAHARALRSNPDLRLILAPRHPRRADEVAAMIRQTGLPFERYSDTKAPTAPILLADTMGDMPLWYALAGSVFVGGSLSDRGGHTPYEPAYFGCAILHGPDTGNFTDAYNTLHAADAALGVHDENSLHDALLSCQTPGHQQALGHRARQALADAADFDELLTAIDEFLVAPKR